MSGDASNYTKLEKVGEGTYGTVYKCIQISTNRVVALKKIRLDDEEEGVPSTALREVSVLMELGMSEAPGSECVVKLLDILHSDSRLCLVFEFLDLDLKKYMDAASLASIAADNAMVTDGISASSAGFGVGLGGPKGKGRSRRGLPADLVAKLLSQLLLGLSYLHSRRILHRDLKPQNLLIDKSGNLKIADFGLARAFGIPLRTYTHEIVTLWYRPPCVLLGGRHYTTAVDVWSVGAIFAEMASGVPLLPGDSEIDQCFRIFRLLGTPTPEVWPALPTMPDFKLTFPKWRPQVLAEILPEMDERSLHLLGGMLVYDPSRRISAKASLHHPYFAHSLARINADPFLGSYNPAVINLKTNTTTERISEGLMSSPIA